MTRPAVTIIMPFSGTVAEARGALASLAAIERGSADNAFLVDNSPRAVVPPGRAARVIRADRLASSYYARNVGAAQARTEWLLFLDADTRPPASLLEDYFSIPIPDRCGIVAGEVDAASGQRALVARHASSRRHLGVAANLLHHGPYEAGGTANLLVRRLAWEELGGFREVRSGADLEFCWRAREAGWEFALNAQARVEHVHAETLAGAVRKAARYGAGQRWSERQWPGSAPRPPLLRRLGRALAGSAVWLLRLRFERAAFKALDGAWALAFAAGYYLGDNQPRPLPGAIARSREGLATRT